MHRMLFSCLAAVLWCSVGLTAQSPAARLTAQDAFNLELPADPQISPDGKLVVYVRSAADIMTDKRFSNLWIVNTDGSGHRPLTSGKHGIGSPRWSPDGTRLAYASDEDGTNQIYVRWMDDGRTIKVTTLTVPLSGLSWSPDGRSLAFTALEPKPARVVAQLPTPPEGAKWADPPQVIDRRVYRFDGAGYLKEGFYQIFVVPAEGGSARQISSGPYNHGSGGLEGASDPVWTPDGRSLLISANRQAQAELDPLNTEVYAFSVTDGAVRALTSRKGPDNDPAVSPDGRLIAYLGFDDRYQGYQVTQLYVMNQDGTGSRSLTAGLDRDAASPQWAADGSGIYFQYDDQGNTKIGFVTLDGKRRTLAGNVGSSASAYGGGSYTVSRTGALAFGHTTPSLPGDVAVLLPGAAPKILTALNEDLLAGKTLAAAEEIWFPSSKDQRRVQGWVLKPPGFTPARKYPLILEIHGGPFANYGDRFDFEKQVWAGMGYVVVYLNPRGSTSYGEEFGNLIHHAYPGDDFYDLDSGVDAVVAKGYVDQSQLYVTGGSGGGVLSAWMIGRTNRFRAAVVQYPVINWTSFALNSDITAFVTKYWFPGMPWDSTDNYNRRSLLSVIKNVKTPSMVITGEEDYRTPISESEQYYQALKLLGVEAVLVRVPGEPHGIRRRPSHWMAKIMEIEGWFAQHRAVTP